MMKIRKALALLLVLAMAALMLPTAWAAAPKAVVSKQGFVVDGAEVQADVYNIDGSNYFKLRDIAYLLKATPAAFSVAFDPEAERVDVTRGGKYDPLGGECAAGSDNSSSCVISKWAIYVDGCLAGMKVYNLGGSNYFRLRDLGAYLGFGVDFDEKTNVASIDSSAGFPQSLADYSDLWADRGGVVSLEGVRASDGLTVSIFCPAAYLDGGKLTDAVVGGYYSASAPILLALGFDGLADEVVSSAAAKGYVVVCAEDGEKAVEWLKAADGEIPGDSEHIVACGKGCFGADALTLGSAVYATAAYCPEIGGSGTAPDGLIGKYSDSLTTYLKANYSTSKQSGPNIVVTIDGDGAAAYMKSVDKTGALYTVDYDTLDAVASSLPGTVAAGGEAFVPVTGAKYVYIRSGDGAVTNAAASMEATEKLKALGSTVNFAVQWGGGADDGFDAAALMSWLDRVCKYENQFTAEEIETVLDLSNSIAGGDYSWAYNESGSCYTISRVTAVANPELKDYEGLSVCIPAAYVSGIDVSGNLIIDKTAKYTNANGAEYTYATAPIIINTGAAGYSASTTGGVGTGYVASGYINVSCGNRGKNNSCIDAEGSSYFCGDSPYCLVDQKAVVRWLKYNIALGNIAGDPDRIVSTGGSGGGAHSLMLAATGNHPDFYPYLEQSGAVGIYFDEEKGYYDTISDAIWGCCPYSPITNLEEADMAYEWEAAISLTANDSLNMSPFKRELSAALAKQYVSYVNSLGLEYDLDSDGKTEKLTLSDDGKSGTYVDFMVEQAESDLEWFLENIGDATVKNCTWEPQNGETTAEAYFYGHYTYKQSINGMQLYGGDLSALGFELSKNPDGSWHVEMDAESFLSYRSRSKTNPAFDTLTLHDRNGDYNAENLEFGDKDSDAKHWDKFVLAAMTDSYDTLEKLYQPGVDADEETFALLYKHYSDDVDEVLAGDEYYGITGSTIVELYNPLRYIMDSETEQPAWVRLVHGTLDKDVSLMSTQNDAVVWTMAGVDVTLLWSWDNVHVANDPLSTTKTAFIDSMCMAEGK